MWAKLKTGKVISGKAAEVFTKIGIATECKAPAKKAKVEKPKEVEAKKAPAKKAKK